MTADTAPHPLPTTLLESRGSTRIADRVVERIAVRAAQETGRVGGPGGGLQALPGRSDQPRVSVTVHGALATMRLTLGIVYPAPVRGTTREVREHVRARVLELTGISVRQLDIDVVTLNVDEEER